MIRVGASSLRYNIVIIVIIIILIIIIKALLIRHVESAYSWC